GLVTNSHSIREFDIKLELYDKDLYDRAKSMKQTNKMFINNKNLEYIAPMHSVKRIDRLKTFMGNPKLKTVKIIIHNRLKPEEKWVQKD
ncbi:MAG: hypothetical protein IJS10_03160, partial [Alphaproteobacteria bacterium]|nr:hypothetical protein [Alphaproteobacteria bacterium]